MRKILTVLSALFLVNGIWLYFRSGVGNTFLLNFGFFLAAGVYAVFYERLIKMRLLNCCIIIAAVLYLGLGIFALTYGRQDTATFYEDVAIVLGAGMRGEEVPPVLQSRLDMAVEYHFRNPSALIIVSGGQGPGDIVTEASAMARYLKENGVPTDLIVQEDRSHSTYQNMRRSKEILDEIFPHLPYGPQVTVITNDFHIYRAVRFTEIVGLQNATSFHGGTPLIALPGALVREVAAIVKMWLIGT